MQSQGYTKKLFKKYSVMRKCGLEAGFLCQKDTDGFTEVLQVPVYGSQTVPQFIGAPVEFITCHLRPHKAGNAVTIYKLHIRLCYQLLTELVYIQEPWR